MKDLLRKIFGPRGIKITAGELAKKFGLELKGNPNEVVSGVAPIADAKSGQLAFYSTERNSNAFKILPIEVLEKTKASVILLQREQIKHAPNGATLLITESPRGDIVKYRACRVGSACAVFISAIIQRRIAIYRHRVACRYGNLYFCACEQLREFTRLCNSAFEL